MVEPLEIYFQRLGAQEINYLWCGTMLSEEEKIGCQPVFIYDSEFYLYFMHF